MEPIIRDLTVPLATDANAQATGSAVVRAGIYGHVAVHVGQGTEGYSITHVATGRAVARGLDRGVAIRVAEVIGQESCWGFKTITEFNAIKSELKQSLDQAMRAATRPQLPQRAAV